jgi:protein-S-isoprenylcysteine O-methyltransferase Ste14
VDQAPWWKNERGEWYVLAQGVLMVFVLAAPGFDRFAWREPWSVASLVAGDALVIAGIVLGVGGVVRLGRNLTPYPRPKRDATLVEEGVYSVVRHPIYAGLALAAIGWGLLWRSPTTLALAAALLVFFDIKSRREELWLVEAFPRYADYRRRVKKLIPFIY